MKAKIVALPGDGIGPEVVAAARKVLDRVAGLGGHQFVFENRLIGGSSLDAHGVPLTDDTLAACKASDAVLLGAVGGPKWDAVKPEIRAEQGLLKLRKGLACYANLRPVKPLSMFRDLSPFRDGHLDAVDVMVVRELTGGVYFGQPRFREPFEGGMRAVDTVIYTTREIERVMLLAFRLAEGRKKKVTSVDKANVLETSRLWRETATAVGAKFPGVALDHMLVDSASMRLITSPSQFDVLVTENMFGDILTDEAAVLAGSLGMLPSASLGDAPPGIYEPIHGSAPDIAGKNIANPVGTILSAAMLLRHSLGLAGEAAAIEKAVEAGLATGLRTPDLGGKASTEQMTQAVLDKLT
jgi:3-isopropylmalate dehydrogenase